MRDLGMEARELINKLQSQVGSIKEIQERVQAAVGHGEAADGRVKITVGPSGALSAVEIDPRAMRMGSEELAEAIIEAAKAATEDVAAQIGGALGDLTGEDGAGLGKMATGNFEFGGLSVDDLDMPAGDDPVANAEEMLRRFRNR